MTPLQINSLLAFLSALSQLDEPLPDAIQNQLNEIAKALSDNPNQLINVDIIAEAYPKLDSLYQREKTALDNAAAQRNKGLPPEPLPTQPNSEITNLAKDVFSEDNPVVAIQQPERNSILKTIRQRIFGNN